MSTNRTITLLILLAAFGFAGCHKEDRITQRPERIVSMREVVYGQREDVERMIRHGWLRVAAMLAIGFGLGFLASESLRPPVTTVVRQLILPAPPVGAAGGFVACDATDVSGGVQQPGSLSALSWRRPAAHRLGHPHRHHLPPCRHLATRGECRLDDVLLAAPFPDPAAYLERLAKRRWRKIVHPE